MGSESERGGQASCRKIDEEGGLITAGVFVTGAVDSIELAVGGQTRRVAIAPDSPAFVIALVQVSRH